MSLNPEHVQWLTNRGIAEITAARYGLKSVEKRLNGRLALGICIPYRRGGNTITEKIRWLNGGDTKWTHPSGGTMLWNEDALIDPKFREMPIVITEGEWDALVALQCGYFRTVSVPCGASSKFELSDKLQSVFKSCRDVILAGDADEPGQELNGELARRFGAARCRRIVYPPDCKDLNDILTNFQSDAVHEILRTAEPYPIKGLYTLSDYPSVERPKMYSTGWKTLDAHCKMWPGEFMVVTGVPNHGKSQFTLELLGSLNRNHQHRSCIAAFEMPIVPFVRDVLREHYWNKRHWQLNEEERARADIWIGDGFNFIDQDPRNDTEEANLEFIVERAEDAVFRRGVHWLLIDPWNQIEHRRERFENELDYQSRAIRALKRFARSYKCGVIVVAHPTKSIVGKDGEIRKPTLYDVSGSAHWANSADHGIIIWRDDLASNRMSVGCVKSRYREAGMPGTAYLVRNHGRLEDGEAQKQDTSYLYPKSPPAEEWELR